MVGHGSHDVPAGTWSDDSSLTFCLAEALAEEFDLRAVSQNFQNWLYHNYWTPRGEVFDVGIATRKAINNLRGGVKPELAGGADESDNGNGSLMRILPLVFFIKDKPIEERFEITKAVSSLTHRHIRSVIACFYYLEFTLGLLETKNAFYVYKELKTIVPAHLRAIEVDSAEIQLFHRLFVNDIDSLHEEEIQSSGYVLHTLEASIWCLLTTGSYKEAVLKAVNLGEDTDSTAAVTGGLAGLLYGIEHIPGNWMSMLARSEDIEDLARRMYKRLDN
jgi:ADP-ribosylglycohydrolase